MERLFNNYLLRVLLCVVDGAHAENFLSDVITHAHMRDAVGVETLAASEGIHMEIHASVPLRPLVTDV